MDRKRFFFTSTILPFFYSVLPRTLMAMNSSDSNNGKAVDLPKAERGAEGSLRNLMYKRRSVREFGPGGASLEQISRLLFAAQGITRKDRFRTVPSAGALYPLEVFLVAGSVEGLEKGVYRYLPEEHRLKRVRRKDMRKEVARKASRQMWISAAPAILVICAVYERTTRKYGARGRRYAHIEAGCAAQNISMEGYNLGLGSTLVGAFDDGGVAEVVKASRNATPLAIMPVGPIPDTSRGQDNPG